MNEDPKLEEGDLEAVVSSAFVVELRLKEFFTIRNMFREWETLKDNFRVIHLTFSNREFYIVKKQEYQRFVEWKKRVENKEEVEKIERSIKGSKR